MTNPSLEADVVDRGARRLQDERLFDRYLQTRDPALRAALIERFLPLARTVALRFRRPSQPIDDIVQVASLALVKAVDRFDPANGVAFSTFAVPTISGEIRRHFRDTSWSVRPPRALLEQALRVQRASDELTRRDGRAPTVAALAEHLQLEEEEVLEARHAHHAMDARSLQERLAPDGDGAAVTREERTGAPDEGFELADDRATLARLLRAIPQREQEVLAMRYFQDMTQREIGERLGVTQMQVSRIVRGAITRLRHVAERQTQSPSASR